MFVADIAFDSLGNFFNAIPRTSPSRLSVCRALVKLASDNDEMDTLHMTPADVNRWTNEWDVSQDEKTAFLKYVADAYSAVNKQYVSVLLHHYLLTDLCNAREIAFTYLQSYVQSIPPSSAAAKSAGLELLASALRLPNTIDTGSLLRLENVQALQGHPLYTLIQAFVKESLNEYKKWQTANDASLREFGTLSTTQMAITTIGNFLLQASIKLN